MEIASALVSAISGLTGVFLGGWLTRKNASKEKLTDLRLNNYGSILYQMSEAEKVFDLADAYVSLTGWDQYFGSNLKKGHEERIASHMNAIEKLMSENYLIISDDFRALRDAFDKEAEASQDIPYYEEDDTFAEALRKYRPLMLAQARKETSR